MWRSFERVADEPEPRFMVWSRKDLDQMVGTGNAMEGSERRKRRRRVTTQVTREVVQLLRSGQTSVEVAASVGFSQSTVERIARKRGVPFHRTRVGVTGGTDA